MNDRSAALFVRRMSGWASDFSVAESAGTEAPEYRPKCMRLYNGVFGSAYRRVGFCIMVSSDPPTKARFTSLGKNDTML